MLLVWKTSGFKGMLIEVAAQLQKAGSYRFVGKMGQPPGNPYAISRTLIHLQQIFHTFAYIKGHLRSRIILDATIPHIDTNRFVPVDWSSFYPDAAEAIPPNAPAPRGNAVVMPCFVDADHAGNKVTRRSHTGIIIFCNRAPIIWFSKRQNTVETSSFGSEFVAA